VSAEDEPLDVWLRFAKDDDETPEEDEVAESEANTYRAGDGFRVEWYHTAVGLVSHRHFSTYEQARTWLTDEGFQDFSS